MNITNGQLKSVITAQPFRAPNLSHESTLEKRVSQTGQKSLGFFAEAWKSFCAFFTSLFSYFKAEKGGLNPTTEAKVEVVEENCLTSVTSILKDAKEAVGNMVKSIAQDQNFKAARAALTQNIAKIAQRQELRTPSFTEARYKLKKKGGMLLKGQEERSQKERFHNAKKTLEGFGGQLLKGQEERGKVYTNAEIKNAEKELKKAVRRAATEQTYQSIEKTQARYETAFKKVPELELQQLLTKAQISLYKIQLKYLSETTLAAKAERAAGHVKESVQTFAQRAAKFLKTGKAEQKTPKEKEATPAEKRNAAFIALHKQINAQMKELGIKDRKDLMKNFVTLAHSLSEMSIPKESGAMKRTRASIEKRLARVDKRYMARQKELSIERGYLTFATFSTKASHQNIDVPFSARIIFDRLRSELKALKKYDKKLAQKLDTKTITDITLPDPKKRRDINELLSQQLAAKAAIDHLKK